MKKLLIGLVTLASLLSIAISFSAPVADKSSGYYSTYHPLNNQKVSTATATKAPLFPPTDVTVVNASANTLYVSVPGTYINDLLYPNGQPDHIRNNDGAFFTTIVLKDNYGNPFWSNTVCPRALITVYGSSGVYTVNTDTEYCY